MSDNLQVSKEFFEEELGQTMPKSKKGGPYSTQAKKLRRDKVFKLHFDYGYSARKIADMIKVNRNTINSDVTYWYSHLKKQDDMISTEDWLNKMFYRLEAQRGRLAEKLDRTTDFTNQLLLEKMIFEIDTKLTQIVVKLETTKQSLYDYNMKVFNNWLEEHGCKERYVLWGQTLRVTPDTSNKIKQAIQSDRYQKPDKPKRYDSNPTNSESLSQNKF